MKNFIKDFIRMIFGLHDNDPVEDQGVWLIIGIVLVVLVISLSWS